MAVYVDELAVVECVGECGAAVLQKEVKYWRTEWSYTSLRMRYLESHRESESLIVRSHRKSERYCSIIDVCLLHADA